MRPVIVITDSCSDLGGDIRAQYGIDYVRMNTLYKEKETPASLDWEYISAHDFYNIMRDPANPRITTTQVPVTEFERAFNEYADKGYDIVYVACAGAMSGSVNTGFVVANAVMEEKPDCTIVVIDSVNASLGEGLVAVEAAKLAKEGKSAKEIAEIINVKKLHLNQFCVAATLEYLKRAGRVNPTKAFFGNLMGVKPIIISNSKGENVSVGKARGRIASLKAIVAELKAVIENPEDQTVFVSHADCPKDAEDIAAMIKAEIGCKDVYINNMGPIIGASVGPDAIGIFGFGKEVA